MVDVRDEYHLFQQAGGQVVTVTMGTVEQAAQFRERLRLPFDCLADPERRAYQAYQIPRAGVEQIAGTRVWAPALRALVRGGVGRPVGDIRQLQALFVVDRDGTVRVARRGRTSADVPSNQQVLQWLREIESAEN